jgi:hypothetical protein
MTEPMTDDLHGGHAVRVIRRKIRFNAPVNARLLICDAVVGLHVRTRSAVLDGAGDLLSIHDQAPDSDQIAMSY